MAAAYTYRARCQWQGSTGIGYDHYHREHTASAEPAKETLTLSSDPALHGLPERLNPEQLVVLAASSCQLMSFLAAAARAHLDVISYQDDAEAVMPLDDVPVRLTRIVLHPRITLLEGPTEQRVRDLVEEAHRECFVANSLRAEIQVHPQIAFRRHTEAAPA